MKDKQQSLLCFGLGYCGTALARRLLSQGWSITGTTRNPDSGDKIWPQGITVLPFSGHPDECPGMRAAISQASHVISTVPASEGGDPVIEVLAAELSAADHLQWAGYLSTTGVYGNTNGAVVDESHPTKPSGLRGERRVRVEQQWLDLHAKTGMPVHIFRLPGIYGPTRSLFDQLRQGKARQIRKPGHKFNRVHVDDIVATVSASITKPNPGAVYNVCDDCPAEPAHVTRYACQVMGIEPPPVVSFEDARADMSPMALSFWQDNRRVSNRRIKNELGVQLRHPDYRSGLDAIWVQENKKTSV